MSAKHTFMAWDYHTDSAGKKLVLLQIANNSNDDGLSWYSIEKMAEACGMGMRTFGRHLKELEDDGVIQIIRRPNKSSVYRLVWRNSQNDVPEKTGTANLAHTNGQFGATGTANLAHDPKRDLKKDPERFFVQELFEKFWKNYPLKINKQVAFKSFAKLVKGKSKSETVLLMNLILNYHMIQVENGVFGADKLHAATLINQRRWEDSPEFMQAFKAEWMAENEHG